MRFLLFFGVFTFLSAQSIDVLRYRIHLYINIPNQYLQGYTEVHFKALQNNLQQVDLMLLKLQVDSIKMGNNLLPYTYNDTILTIMLPSVMNSGDSAALFIYYQGTPQQDASFGGFYFTPAYAYNIGVGMSANPHSFGRVWFPCIDDFRDRAFFEFFITTDSPAVAVCNGLLQQVQNLGNGKTLFHWKLNQPIPPYLASVAVSRYVAVQDTFIGIQDTIPVRLYALAFDTIDLKNSFVNLPSAFHGFEALFGPYRWDRVGYVVVPFNAGAMEHATNIAYPQLAVNGLTIYETLMAHELSHHWFGNLVNCAFAYDMWLNEGFATYCEALFKENLYGKAAYTDYIRKMLSSVLRTTHIKDGGYWAISGVPHSLTYSSTVYEKGACVIHTLRARLGDSLFFNGLKNYLNQYAFQAVTSDSLKRFLQIFSGENLEDFFRFWVYSPGFCTFILDSTYYDSTFLFLNCSFTQRLKGTTQYCMDLRVPVYTLHSDKTLQKHWVSLAGANPSVTFSLSTAPIAVFYDPYQEVADAKLTRLWQITQTGNLYDADLRARLTVQQIKDTAYVQVINYMVDPAITLAGYEPSKERFWRIQGWLPDSTHIALRLYYNGNKSYTSGYWDTELFEANPQLPEDSLVLLYRPHSGAPWTVLKNAQLNTAGNNTDRVGYFDLDTLRFGDYAIAFKKNTTKKEDTEKSTIQLVPNPTKGWIYLIAKPPIQDAVLKITDLQGRVVARLPIHMGKKKKVRIPLPSLSQGYYHFQILKGEEIFYQNTFWILP